MTDDLPDITNPKTFAKYAIAMIVFGLMIGYGFHITFSSLMVPSHCINDTPNLPATGQLKPVAPAAICYYHLTTIQGVEIIFCLIAFCTLAMLIFHQIPEFTEKIMEKLKR
jgi:hypothetical protein